MNTKSLTDLGQIKKAEPIDEFEPTCVTALPVDQRKVLSLLQPGKANAITSKQIVALTGLSNQGIREIIHQLVVKHKYLIGATNERDRPGYYLVENESERSLAELNLKSRISHMARRATVLRKGKIKPFV